ncbi:MAG: PAS domain S-box protein [Methanomicrobiaceae archaeon]|nr:PAS domain S-box protein [Methanomicrobiaceae archaeon]
MTEETKTDIINDISVLYELALSIGNSIDPKQNSGAFIRTLLERKNYSFAAVWISDDMLGISDKGGYSLFYAYPGFRVHTKHLPTGHPFCSPDRDPDRPVILSSGTPGYSDIMPEDGSEGTCLVYFLGTFGFLVLHRRTSSALQTHRDINQLRGVMGKFAVSLEGGLAHSHLLKEEQKERKQAEKERAATETLYKTIMSSTGTAMVLLAKDTTITGINKEMERLFGYSEEELVGIRKGTDFIHPDDIARVLENREKRRTEPDSVSKQYEVRFIPRSGRVKYGLMTIGSIPGTPNTIVSIIDTTQRKKAIDLLVKSEQKYRDFANSLPELVFECDDTGLLTFINRAGSEILGFHDTACFHNILDPLTFASEQDRIRAIEYFQHVIEGREPRAVELSIRKTDGTALPVIVHASPVIREGGITGVRAVATDISTIKQIQERLEHSLSEKDVLMKELHHRVKNNLQVISALIALQSDTIDNGAAKTALSNAQERIMSIAILHENLYKSKDFLHIDFSAYIDNLVSHLSSVFGTEQRNVSITTHVGIRDLTIDTAIPCGLIVSEIVSNSMKYAFPDNRAGIITINITRDPEGVCTMIVADDGVGFTPGEREDHAPSLGLHLIRLLATGQLDGTLDIDTGNGVTFKIQFKMNHNY